MKLTLNELIDEMLSFEKVESPKPSTLLQRIHNFAKRKEIEKGLQDELEAENQQALKLGKDAESFLKSSWYRDLVEPHLRQTIRGGIQTIIREGESLTEAQLKAKIAVIKEALGLAGSLKLKIIRAEEIKERLK